VATFDKTQVQLDVLQQAAQTVSQAKQDIAAQLTALQQEVEGYISPATLGGQFATVFQDVHTRWTQDSVRLTNALQNIADLLQQNHLKYHYAQQTQVQSMSTVRNRLNIR
jgi:WXG100 family type VII secretion target